MRKLSRMTLETFVFFSLLLIVAFLYSSVGHGGASGYLALMAFFSFSVATMRPTALVLNVFVSAIAFIQYYRCGHFQWKLFWPFAITSIPAAFVGGMIDIDETIYKKILGILLLFSVIRLAGLGYSTFELLRKQNIIASLLIGLLIGLFSGMIGIGGGIILSPLILFLRWTNLKQAAAVSALFIFVNSMAGLAGILSKNFYFDAQMGAMLIVALIGGFAGAYMGAKRFNTPTLRYSLAMVLLIASIKLILT